MEDQPADSGDLTTGEPEKPRRRLRFGRRRRADEVADVVTSDESDAPAADAEAEADADEADAEATPERRTPVGKTRRKAVAEPEGSAEPEGASQPETETVAEAEAEAESVAEAEPEPETVPDAEPVPGEEPDAEPQPEADTEAAAGAEADVDAEVDADADAESSEEAEETVLVPHRPAGKRLTYIAVGAAALFVVAGAFGGAMVQPYLADRALVATKLQVAQTSADAITTLWTYNPENIESLPDRAARYLSNDFANQYRQLIDSLVPTNKQAQVTNNTEVMGTAVETISRDEATAIVYTNTVSTSPVTKNVPSLRYMSYRLTLQRSGGDWLITQMPALTQLDLSPQL